MQPERAEVIDIPSRYELLLQNERLKDYLEAARLDVANWRAMWVGAHDARAAAEVRADKAARVLASIGRLSPFAAALVERARVEVWGRLP